MRLSAIGAQRRFASTKPSTLTFGMVLRCALLMILAATPSHAQTWVADNGNGTYTNPLFYDEFADPDVIRVGKGFYLVGSSMHMNPGLALLHSRDLVNWDFVSYAMQRLDLGPAYRLEGGGNIYGQGIWAPCLRYHDGTFYIFANVNGQTTQMFRARRPQGPWTRTPMRRSFHDLSVLFDDDGKVYVVWNYGDVRIARLDASLTDIVPGTARLLIPRAAGMGEGHHLLKIHGRYYLFDAWYNGVMRMPVARADKLTGPWEVNRNISVGEQFGQVLGWRLSTFRPPLTTKPPYTMLPPDPSAVGRMAIHQGTIIDTPTGEWWGLSMGEENALGRVLTLSPITWTDGWPYFGLAGNLGRSPRTWVKPHTGTVERPHAPYVRSDDFTAPRLQPVWQWNHVPNDTQWSLTERSGYLRLHALPATSLWDARNTLTQRSIGPRSIPTAVLETQGLQRGDVAGLALLIQPDAWIGVEKGDAGAELVQHDGQTMHDKRVPLRGSRVWLRVDCEFASQLARFSYSVDGTQFHAIGAPFRMVTIGVTFQGVRYALFSLHRGAGAAGFADFDSFHVDEPAPHGLMTPVPYRRSILLRSTDPLRAIAMGADARTVVVTADAGTPLRVVDRRLGRVALQAPGGFLSVAADGKVSLRMGAPRDAETFQWIESFAGDLTLLSLETHRYLRVDAASGTILADSPGPEPNGPPGVRFAWRESGGGD